MWTAYIDESGTEDKQHVVVAGFLGSKEQWEKFGPEWIRARGQKESIHCKELRWKEVRTERLLRNLGEAVQISGILPMFGVVRVPDFIDLVPDEMRKRFKGYLLAIYPAIQEVLSLHPHEQVKFVLEEQREYAPTVRSLFDMFRQHGRRQDISLEFVPKGGCMFLEPADCLAFCILQSLRSRQSRKATLCERILGDGFGIGEYLSREKARGISRRMVQWMQSGRLSQD